jgi:hypothetical protein
MASFFGKHAFIRLAGGDPVALDDGETYTEDTDFTAHTVYKIDNKDHVYLDQDTAITVNVDGSPADPEDYTIEYIGGRIVFNSAISGSAAVTTDDGAYLPVIPDAVAGFKGWSLEVDRAALDSTELGDSSWSEMKHGIASATGSLSGFYADDTFLERMNESAPHRTVLSLQLKYDSTNPSDPQPRFECLAVVSTLGVGVAYDELTSQSISFTADGRVYLRTDEPENA